MSQHRGQTSLALPLSLSLSLSSLFLSLFLSISLPSLFYLFLARSLALSQERVDAASSQAVLEQYRIKHRTYNLIFSQKSLSLNVSRYLRLATLKIKVNMLF